MNRIKDIIKEKGYTQEGFAKILGISRAGLVQQLDKPSYTTLEKFSKALDVPMWQLFVSLKDLMENSNISEIFDNSHKEETSIICPHCGKEIKIETKVELKK